MALGGYVDMWIVQNLSDVYWVIRLKKESNVHSFIVIFDILHLYDILMMTGIHFTKIKRNSHPNETYIHQSFIPQFNRGHGVVTPVFLDMCIKDFLSSCKSDS
jgi:hypothetical protein